MYSSDESGRTRPWLGVAYVLVAAILFSVNGSVSKTLLSGTWSPLQLVEVRCLAAGLVFFLLTAVRRPAALRIGLREFGFVVLYGVVGVALVQWLY